MTEWTVGPQPVVWDTPILLGDGSNAQGGVAPAEAYEPAVPATDETLYDRFDWYVTPAAYTPGTGDTKFRITSEFGFFGSFDPILMPGMAGMAHHHTFYGNLHADENSTYESLRANPGSSNAGGPLNGTLYWEPTMFFIDPVTGLHLPVKPNIVTFYYAIGGPTFYRLLRGLQFIGGVDPSDRLNVARLAEIPDGAGWNKNKRYNGWHGWFIPGGTVQDDPDGLFDISEYGLPRNLVGPNGEDPWGGTAEDPDYEIIGDISAPQAWDGNNLSSPNGRNHFRYVIDQQDSSFRDVPPQNWFLVPFFSAKPQFPNSGGGLSGHDYRKQLYLSSDRYNTDGTPRDPEDWHPPCSTMHFDWQGGWDDVVLQTWLQACTGVTINGVTATGADCNSGTINDEYRLTQSTRPAGYDASFSRNPVVTSRFYAHTPTKEAFGVPPLQTRIPFATASA